MLKYLLIFVVVVVGYMVTWTVVSLDHVTTDGQSRLVETRHVTGSNVALTYCTLGWWHYVIEIGSFTGLSNVEVPGSPALSHHIELGFGRVSRVRVAIRVSVIGLGLGLVSAGAKV